MCNIDAFVAYYRATMDSSFIPKLHMLEEHVAPFIRQWRVGLGMLGEQGVEGIHARFNTLELSLPRKFAVRASVRDKSVCYA